MKLQLTILSVLFLRGAAYGDVEPSYCQPQNFIKTEVKLSGATPKHGIFRAHSFKLGKVLLTGMAVGDSLPSEVAELATDNSTANSSEGYCTWYFNKYNVVAERDFNWLYVSKPGNDAAASAAEFGQTLSGIFDLSPVNFLGCMERHHYVALGCNNQQHRGPSVFAMLLSFSGCTPAHSVALANYYWGLNGVPLATRTAIAEMGYHMGTQRPLSRAKMAALFSGQ